MNGPSFDITPLYNKDNCLSFVHSLDLLGIYMSVYIEASWNRFNNATSPHLACHGMSDQVDPSERGLLLQTARTAMVESRQDLLSVREVCQANLPGAEIAYLSACSTAALARRINVCYGCSTLVVQ